MNITHPYPFNSDIKRFCEVQKQINEVHEALTKEYNQFYSGGHTFEECNSELIRKLNLLEKEFIILLRVLK